MVNYFHKQHTFMFPIPLKHCIA